MKLKGNKAFKTFKILLIIVLCVVLGVSLLKYFNLYSEGFSSNEELADYQNDKSTCDTNKEGAVPACYSTVQENRGNEYMTHEDSDFILKTQIETPTCPNTPYEYGNGGFGSLITENGHIETPNDNWLKKGTGNSSYNTPSVSVPQTSDSTPSTLESPYTIQSDIAIDSPQNNTTGFDSSNLQYPTLNPAPEPVSTDTMTTTPNVSAPTSVRSDTCPPCPACERCPEPVVECKKVVNYTNAANSGQLPVPYINDFSKF